VDPTKIKSKFTIFGYELNYAKIVAFVISATLLGLFAELGKDLYNLIKTVNKNDLSSFYACAEKVAFYKLFEVNVITALIFILLFIPLYRFIDKKIISRLISEMVFFDNFAKDIGWVSNYWGSTNPQKTNRIQNGCMVFEAIQNEWPTQNYENGAYIDLRNGITEGLNYTIKCKVKSSLDSTMGFKLWLHDIKGNNSMSNPITFETPPSDDYKEYSLTFKATETNGIRVHLHCKAGVGFLMVDSVKVIRGK
jgi:hypothetical protein